jgi:hypothetical protein
MSVAILVSIRRRKRPCGAFSASRVPVIPARLEDRASAFKLYDLAFFLGGPLGDWRRPTSHRQQTMGGSPAAPHRQTFKTPYKKYPFSIAYPDSFPLFRIPNPGVGQRLRARTRVDGKSSQWERVWSRPSQRVQSEPSSMMKTKQITRACTKCVC